jgi:hypothetical protein
MTATINASTSAGVVTTADTSGILQLQTNGTAALTVDASQNVGIGTASPVARLQAVGTDGTAGGTNTVLRLLGNIGGVNKSGGLFFRTLNSTTVGTERIALIQSTDVDNNDRVLALNSTGGNVLIGTATNNASGGVLQVSNGITFPATQSASSDANTLDDYEEGTWTPAYAPATNSFTSISYGFNDGKYVKIGNMVYVAWRMRTSALSVGSASGSVVITGLPFAVSSLDVYFALGIGTAFAVNNAASALASNANTYINLQQERNNTNIVVTDLSTSSANNFTAGFVCYQV